MDGFLHSFNDNILFDDILDFNIFNENRVPVTMWIRFYTVVKILYDCRSVERRLRKLSSALSERLYWTSKAQRRQRNIYYCVRTSVATPVQRKILCTVAVILYPIVRCGILLYSLAQYTWTDYTDPTGFWLISDTITANLNTSPKHAIRRTARASAANNPYHRHRDRCGPYRQHHRAVRTSWRACVSHSRPETVGLCPISTVFVFFSGIYCIVL